MFDAERERVLMQYLITFLEGLISFLSPCMLPMLPVYVGYFAGESGRKGKVFLHSLFFVLGITLVYCLMGLFAGSLGMLMRSHRRALDLITGGIVILFGLSYLEVIKLPFFKGMEGARKVSGLLSAFLFGLVYSVSLTPCVGAFLGSALMLAANSETALRGLSLLLVFSLGLGLPFILSAVLIDRLHSTFAWVKRHYKAINLICGLFLILVGVLMALGLFRNLMMNLM